VPQRYSDVPVNTTNVHKYNQSIPLAYISFILSLLHVLVPTLDHQQAVIINMYILSLPKCTNMDPY
jgi:hypothetical protein